jgi:hypothetical protein
MSQPLDSAFWFAIAVVTNNFIHLLLQPKATAVCMSDDYHHDDDHDGRHHHHHVTN